MPTLARLFRLLIALSFVLAGGVLALISWVQPHPRETVIRVPAAQFLVPEPDKIPTSPAPQARP